MSAFLRNEPQTARATITAEGPSIKHTQENKLIPLRAMEVSPSTEPRPKHGVDFSSRAMESHQELRIRVPYERQNSCPTNPSRNTQHRQTKANQSKNLGATPIWEMRESEFLLHSRERRRDRDAPCTGRVWTVSRGGAEPWREAAHLRRQSEPGTPNAAEEETRRSSR